MNRMLASALSLLNGLIALLLVLAFGLIGWTWPSFGDAHGLGLAIGLVAGIVTATLACGTIAILSLIEKHLRTLVAQRGSSAPTHGSPPTPARTTTASTVRIEPTL
ncbi:hypothetical protein [Labrys sp. ZIDIC5]|uniref:hypothetical protein n=1 Tax=Labrys sedimenti TaxID=3106036 RepID=UPI002ACA7DEE|nr:hypothetical protein [Labrys sp. ZIDIC5]MDZ5448263.1 hypothetical protein [Labrys sp. ZIDIC5]